MYIKGKINEEWIFHLTSLWDKYKLSQEEWDKHCSWKYNIGLQDWRVIFTLKSDDVIQELNLQEVYKNRMSEYPEIGEQLDIIYKDMINWTSDWTTLITDIKNKYPKPE